MSNKISTKVKDEILIELVEPCYKTDIKELINERKFWRKTGNYFESASKVFIGASSIVSFASGIYSYQLLSFFSGTTGVLSLVCMQFSSYSYNESKERTTKLNKLLDKLKIETVPDISAQPFAASYQQQTPYTVAQTYQSSYPPPPPPVYRQVYHEPPSYERKRSLTPPPQKEAINEFIKKEELEITPVNIIEDKEEKK
jgi:hypothetical protein